MIDKKFMETVEIRRFVPDAFNIGSAYRITPCGDGHCKPVDAILCSVSENELNFVIYKMDPEKMTVTKLKTIYAKDWYHYELEELYTKYELTGEGVTEDEQ